MELTPLELEVTIICLTTDEFALLFAELLIDEFFDDDA